MVLAELLGFRPFAVVRTTVVTTYTSTEFAVRTGYTTLVTSLFRTTTVFATDYVTRSNVDVETVTKYVTSTRFVKRTAPGPALAERTAGPAFIKRVPVLPSFAFAPMPTAGAVSPFVDSLRDKLEDIGLLKKRLVTSTVTSFDFRWVTTTSVSSVFSTSYVPTTVYSTYISRLTSTIVRGATSTTTVFSTLIVTVPSPTDTTITTPTDTPTDPTTGPTTKPTTGPATSPTTLITTDSGGRTIVITQTATTSGSTETPVVAAAQPELSVGAKAGIGAGAAAGGLALLGGLAFFLVARKKRGTPSTSPDTSQAPMSPAPMANVSTPSWTPPPHPPPHTHFFDSQGMPVYAAAAAAAAGGAHHSFTSNTPTAGGGASGGVGSVSPIDRGASPASHASELMGYQSPHPQAHEIGTGYMGYSGGPVNEFYEMPAQQHEEVNLNHGYGSPGGGGGAEQGPRFAQHSGPEQFGPPQGQGGPEQSGPQGGQHGYYTHGQGY
jgi:hypothetical protein